MSAVFLTDSHAHLDVDAEPGAVAEVLARARAAGVDRVLTVSSRLGDFEQVVTLAEAHEGVFAAVGVHPHEAAGLDDSHLARLRTLASRERVLAIGEIGLDYHYEHSPREVQQDAFRRQLRLAAEVRLPVVVHSREAEDDTARILAEEPRTGAEPGVLHCFTSDWRLARRCLDLGYLVSFSGIVTFKDAAPLREAARRVPADKLLVETDSPYLAPAPHRGRRNEPAYVRATAEAVARERSVRLDELAAVTSANFERAFLAPRAATRGGARPASR